MPKKWKKNRPFQNWKKAFAVFLWNWVILFTAAQTHPNLPEISPKDGLPTSSARRVVELTSGTAMVATDGGLYYTPKKQKNLDKIVTRVGNDQCWDLHISGNTLSVATYNNGLFIFDVSTGNIIQHYKKNQLNKIRRLREIGGTLYCIAQNGVYEITVKKAIRRFNSNLLPKSNIPMDVFFWQNKMHILNYPQRLIMQQQEDGKWENLQNVMVGNNQRYPTEYYCNLTSFQSGSDVFLGGVNSYTVLNEHGEMRHYTLKKQFNEAWAFWDFQSHNNIVYAAVSNSNDFDDGFMHIHSADIFEYNPPHLQPLWSITPSKFRDAMWACSETDGVHLIIQPNKILHKQTELLTQVKATKGFIVRHGINYVSFEPRNPPANEAQKTTTHSHVFYPEDRIREVAEINGEVFLMGANKMWKYNPKTAEFTSLFNAFLYQWLIEKNGLLWFFQPYGSVYTYNTSDKSPICTNYIAKADCVRKYENNIYYHQMGIGFAVIDEKGNYHPLTSNTKINQYTLSFEVVQNHLIIQNGNQYDVYKIDILKHSLTFLKKINISDVVRDMQVLQIESSNQFLIAYTGKYLLELDIFNNKQPVKIVRQLYLGNWRSQGKIIKVGDQFVIDRGSSVQAVSFQANSKPNFAVQYSYTNEPESFFRPYFSVNTEKNFKITVTGTNYFNALRSIYGVELTNVYSQKKRHGFFAGDAFYWINGIGSGKFNLSVSNAESWRSHFIIGTTEYYRDFPFWLSVFSLLTLLFWVFYNQTKQQESLQKRIATLQLQTLQSNFNPHFIFNSMSLIQSLIIGSESKKAIDVTARLAKLNRLFLSNSKKELIYLKEELDFIKEYVAMEKLRFESDTNFPFQIKLSSKVKVSEWLIPPLILQPIVENAIKHGVLASKQISEITINIQLLSPEIITIEVINNGVSSANKRSQGMGMGNTLVSDRLAVFNELYPNQFHATFKYGYNETRQYVASIRIEKLQMAFKSTFANWPIPRNFGGGVNRL